MTKKQKDQFKGYWEILLKRKGFAEITEDDPCISGEIDPDHDPDPATCMDNGAILNILYMITSTDDINLLLQLRNDLDVRHLTNCVHMDPGKMMPIVRTLAERDQAIDLEKVETVLFEPED